MGETPNHLKTIIFFPHRLREEKGLSVLLEAHKLLMKTMANPPLLVFAGKGPKLKSVQEAARQYPDTIHYLGFIESQQEIAMLHASADVGLALSTGETFGLAMLESMASGKPQIGASQGEAGEHISASGAGIQLAHISARTLADALASLMGAPEQSVGLSVKARRYAERFSWKSCFAQQRRLYRNLLSQ